MTEKIDSNQAFRELVASGIVTYGYGTDKLQCGVAYGEHFAKCYSGCQTIDNFEELKDLYLLWKEYDWTGVVAWLSKKEGCLPLYWYVEGYEKRSTFRFSTLNLPPNPGDAYYRKLSEELKAKLGE